MHTYTYTYVHINMYMHLCIHIHTCIRIYLHKKVLGQCRESKTPLKRVGRACELNLKYPDLDYLPHGYMGGARCSAEEQVQTRTRARAHTHTWIHGFLTDF